jgi:hypothetical protein
MLSQQEKQRDAGETARMRHAILDLPLNQFLHPEYALQLQQILQLYTVANLLQAWRDPSTQREIEGVFMYPEQAHHVVVTCAAWLGMHTVAAPGPVDPWWSDEALPAPGVATAARP